MKGKPVQYLLSYGEIALKGKNQNLFLKRLADNLRQQFKGLGEVRVQRTYGRLFLKTEIEERKVTSRLQQTFGLTGFAKVQETALEYEELEETVVAVAGQAMNDRQMPKSFKIAARRANKAFPETSMDLNRKLGAAVVSQFPDLKVQMQDPDLTLSVEVREKGAYVYTGMIEAPGGLPVGSSGRGLLLLSGGIDSPVAGWMLLKRGMAVAPVHFHSPPFTSVRSRQKVIDLATRLTHWGGLPYLRIVNIAPIQLLIQKSRRQDLTTLLSRMVMMRISDHLARDLNFQALLTGENLGQVASQTIESMTATEQGLNRPVLRPLIGFDKREIIQLSQRIDTYETSIQPYEDCCTLFLPDNPRIKPRVHELKKAYQELNLEEELIEAIGKIEIIEIGG